MSRFAFTYSVRIVAPTPVRFHKCPQRVGSLPCSIPGLDGGHHRHVKAGHDQLRCRGCISQPVVTDIDRMSWFNSSPTCSHWNTPSNPLTCLVPRLDVTFVGFSDAVRGYGGVSRSIRSCLSGTFSDFRVLIPLKLKTRSLI